MEKDGRYLTTSNPIDMGNAAQFTEVYNSYFRPLCYFSQRYLGDRKQAEDAVAEVFTRLWRQRTRFQDTDHARSYLYRATYNTCYTLQKAAEGKLVREGRFMEQFPEADESYTHQIVRSELWARVYRSIYALPPQCSKVIQLSYLWGLSNEEIARQLKLSIQTVKNHKQRGLTLLRGRLSHDAYLLLLLSIGFM